MDAEDDPQHVVGGLVRNMRPYVATIDDGRLLLVPLGPGIIGPFVLGFALAAAIVLLLLAAFFGFPLDERAADVGRIATLAVGGTLGYAVQNWWARRDAKRVVPALARREFSHAMGRRGFRSVPLTDVLQIRLQRSGKVVVIRYSALGKSRKLLFALTSPEARELMLRLMRLVDKMRGALQEFNAKVEGDPEHAQNHLDALKRELERAPP